MRKFSSRKIIIICCSAFLGLFLIGCANKPLPVPPLDSAMVADLSHLNKRELWTVSALPTFGDENSDTVRVFIAGDVKRPGIYHVPRDTNVEGLIELAMGAFPLGTRFIARKNPLGEREQLDFRGSKGFEQFQSTTLQNGDYVYMMRPICIL